MKAASLLSRSLLLFSSMLLLPFLSPLLLRTVFVDGHARMECPPPLSGATGEKSGPCDIASDNGSLEAFPLKANALNTVTWLESISHPGAPVRFALSRDAGPNNNNNVRLLDESTMGFETCLLLDHIPHDARSEPTFRDQSTWHRSSITLWIPDILCERCYLQLISVMSDAAHGVPADTLCSYAASSATKDYPACPAVYHSCAPVSIDGSVPRNDFGVCNTKEFEERLEWPLTRDKDPGLYEYSVYYNRGDVGLYNLTDARLIAVGSPLTDATCTSPSYCDPAVSFQEILTVPDTAAYTSLEGSCAVVTGTKVEAYKPGGILPYVTNMDEEAEAVGSSISSSSNVASLTSSAICATIAAIVILMSLSL